MIEQVMFKLAEALEVIRERDKEIASLKSLLGKERDEFGKRETELMVKVQKCEEIIAKKNNALALESEFENERLKWFEARLVERDAQISELVEALKHLLEGHDGGDYATKDCSSSYCCGSQMVAAENAGNVLAKHTKPSGSSGVGKEGCVCSAGCVVHRTDGPCYHTAKEDHPGFSRMPDGSVVPHHEKSCLYCSKDQREGAEDK